MIWTDKKVAKAKNLLQKMPLHSVAAQMGLTVDSVRRALEKRGISTKSVDLLKEHTAKNEASKLLAQQKTLLTQLSESKAQNAFIEEARRRIPPPRIIPREKTSGLREATAVILASDWHVEEMVTLVGCAGRNEYNLAIAERRAHRFFNASRWLLDHHRQSFLVRDVVLWLGGDLISGYIHEELAETNFLSPNKAVCFVFGLLSDGIRSLLADPKLERIIIPCSHGNHGRTTPKRRIKTGAANSFEWLLYNMLRQAYATEKRVSFIIDESAHQYLDAYDFTLHFHHGDEVKFGGGVGGVAIPLMKRVSSWDSVRPAHYHHIGHFHQYLDFGRCVVNGSLIGYNDYAMSIGAKYEAPQQAFYLLDSKRGKTMCAPLWVTGDVKAKRVAA